MARPSGGERIEQPERSATGGSDALVSENAAAGAVCSDTSVRSGGTVRPMSRTLFCGGQVFDGTGSPVADGDVVVEGGRVVAVGPGLDGDDQVDCAGMTLLPGLFDCHVHLAITDISAQRRQQKFAHQPRRLA